MENAVTLGFDLGTTNTKVCALTDEGRILFTLSQPTQTIALPTGAEIDPKDLISDLDTLLREAVSRVHESADLPIRAIAFAGMGEAGYLADFRNEPITNIILWYDRRGEKEAEEIKARYEEQIIRVSGIRVSNVAVIYKLCYLKKEIPLGGLRWIGVPELAALHFSGRWFTDPTLAVRYGCYNLQMNRYSQKILETLDLEPFIFPPFLNALHQDVTILPEMAEWFGLSKNTRIIIAGHDDIVSAYGAELNLGEMVDSVGTAESLVTLSAACPNPLLSVRRHAGLAPYFIEGRFAVISGVGTTGNLYRQLQETLGRSPAEIDALASAREAYPANAARAEVTPKKMTRLTLAEDLTPAQTANAVYDLIADAFAERAESVISLTGTPSLIRFIGGGARSEELCARKAARLGIPFVRDAEKEPAAYGAARIALENLQLNE